MPQTLRKRFFVRRPATGAILALTLIALIVVSLFIAAMTQALAIDYQRARQSEKRMQARWFSESALQRARHALATSRSYAGEIWMVPAETAHSKYPVRVSIHVDPIGPSTNERFVRIEVLDPLHDSASVIFRSERLIEIPVPTDSQSAGHIPANSVEEAHHG